VNAEPQIHLKGEKGKLTRKQKLYKYETTDTKKGVREIFIHYEYFTQVKKFQLFLNVLRLLYDFFFFFLFHIQ